MIICSIITFQGFLFCSLAKLKLKKPRMSKPQITLAIIAVGSFNNRTGTIKVNAKTNLKKNVESVAPRSLLSYV